MTTVPARLFPDVNVLIYAHREEGARCGLPASGRPCAASRAGQAAGDARRTAALERLDPSPHLAVILLHCHLLPDVARDAPREGRRSVVHGQTPQVTASSRNHCHI